MIRATEISDATIPNGAIQTRLIVPPLAARRPPPGPCHIACRRCGPRRRRHCNAEPWRASSRWPPGPAGPGRGGQAMKFGIFYELQLPRPWLPGGELQLYQNALDQVELADRLGYAYAWEVRR